MQVWKVTLVRLYQDAVNHVYVGEVIDNVENYVKLRCAAFHFKNVSNGLKDIKMDEIACRIIPWSRIEVIDILSPVFEINEAQLVGGENKNYDVIFRDGCGDGKNFVYITKKGSK